MQGLKKECSFQREGAEPSVEIWKNIDVDEDMKLTRDELKFDKIERKNLEKVAKAFNAVHTVTLNAKDEL